MTNLLRNILIVASLAALAGCAHNGSANKECCDTTDKTTAKVTVVNSVCPIAGDDFETKERSSDLVRQVNGEKVGFCCDTCTAKFDKMSEEKKQAVLTAAKANKAL